VISVLACWMLMEPTMVFQTMSSSVFDELYVVGIFLCRLAAFVCSPGCFLFLLFSKHCVVQHLYD